MKYTKNLSLILLILILVGGFALRLYRFDNPIADWHSWRQADTSAVSRNFVEHGFDLLHPRFDDLSNIPSGVDNPEGYRFVEFPLYNIAQAGLSLVFPFFTLEQWGRLVTIFSSTLAALFLYLIVSRHSNKKLGLLTAFFYAFTPYNIFYGRTILPDTSMAMAVLGGIYFFDKWLENKSQVESHKSKVTVKNKKLLYYVLALLFTASAFLLKPYALFFILPMLYLAYAKYGWSFLKKWQLWFFIVISVIPLGLWRVWMAQFPEGIPANIWLLNGNGIRFRPSFFRWIFYERLTLLISGYFGIIIFLFGLYKVKQLKEWLFFASFLLSSLLYVVVFATGNVQHDYYQILIMPSLAIFFAIGSYFLYEWSFKKFPIGKILLVVCMVGFLLLSWSRVKDYFNINNRSLMIAGEAVDRLTPKDAKVIANYTGDTSFLYQTKRKGWPSFEKPMPEMIAMGADYLVLVNPTPQDMEFGKTYKVVSKTSDYVLFNLRQKP